MIKCQSFLTCLSSIFFSSYLYFTASAVLLPGLWSAGPLLTAIIFMPPSPLSLCPLVFALYVLSIRSLCPLCILWLCIFSILSSWGCPQRSGKQCCGSVPVPLFDAVRDPNPTPINKQFENLGKILPFSSASYSPGSDFGD